MTTATGDAAIDFKVQSIGASYTPSTMAKVGSNSPICDLDIVTGPVLKPGSGASGPFGLTRWRRTDTWNSTGTLKCKIEIGNPAGGDSHFATLLDSTGAGYMLELSRSAATDAHVVTVTGVGSKTTVVNASIVGLASGDVLELWYNYSTNVLDVYRNTSIISALSGNTSTAVTSGLRPGLGFDAENSNSTTMKSWAADGLTVVGGSKLLSQLANQGGF